MSLIKNLKRQEVEIFGARRIVRNSNVESKNEKEVEQIKDKKKTKRTKQG